MKPILKLHLLSFPLLALLLPLAPSLSAEEGANPCYNDAPDDCPDDCPDEESPEDCNSDGNPVTSLSGSVNRTIDDLSLWNVPGKGRVNFSRKALSRRRGQTGQTPFGGGHQWFHSFQYELTGGEEGAIQVRQPSGYACTYFPTNKAGGRYWAQSKWWRGESLNRTEEGFVLTLPNTEKVIFEERKGKDGVFYLATCHLDKRKCETWMRYDEEGFLQRVDLPGGSYFLLEWQESSTGMDVLSRVSTHDGRSVGYDYRRMVNPKKKEFVCDVLSQVTYNEREVATYHYRFHRGKHALPPLLYSADDTRYPGAMTSVIYEYRNPYGMLKQEIDPTSKSVVLERFVDEGHVVFRDGKGEETRYVTDERGTCIMAMIHPEGSVEQWSYMERPIGRFVTSYTDGDSCERRYTRKRNGQLMERCSPEDGLITTYERNYFDQVTRMIETPKRGQPRITQYHYRSPGGLVRKDYPDGTFEKWKYNTEDPTRILLDIHTLRDGSKIRYTYDDFGRKTSEKDANGSTKSWTYYPNGLIKTFATSPWSKTSYEYDDHGRKTKETFYDDSFYTYQYNRRGDVVRKEDSTGRVWTWAHDQFRRVTVATDPAGGQTKYTYGDGPDCQGCTTSSQPILTVSPEGRRTRRVYDAEDRLISLTVGEGTPEAETTSYRYNARGLRTQMVAPNGAITNYSYDEEGRVIEVVQAVGELDLTTTTRYNGFGERVRIVSPTGAVTRYRYDQMGRVVTIIDPTRAITRSVYDAAGRMITSIDPLGQETQYQYDAGGRRIATLYPDGTSTSQSYNKENQMVANSDELGNQTTRSFNPVGRVKTVTDATGATTQYVPRAAVRSGNHSVISPEGRRVVTQVDELGRLSWMASASGTEDKAMTIYRYDKDSNRIHTTDPRKGQTRIDYDALNRPIKQTDPLGRVTTTEYRTADRLVVVTAPDQSVTSTLRDALGRTIAAIDAAGETLSYTYDGDSRRIATLTDANGEVTKWSYDSRGLLLRKTYPDGQGEEYRYDELRRMASLIRADGKRQDYSYDQRGRLLSIRYRDGLTPTVRHQYDAAGRRVSTTNGVATTRYTYDARGLVLREEQSFQAVPNEQFILDRSYDGDRNVSSLVYPDGQVADYRYNARGEMAEVYLAGAPPLATYQRGRDGLVEAIHYENGTSTTKTYDKARQLRAIEHFGGQNGILGAPVLASHHYIYDQAGRRISQTYADGTIDDYQYDLIGQVVAANYGGTAASQSFAYDAMGNRLSSIDGGQTTSYFVNSVNQYQSITSPTIPPSGARRHDAKGNLLHDGTRAYQWDSENRLLNVSRQDLRGRAGRVSYRYDALGRRVLRQNGRERTLYLYDGWNVIAEYRSERRGAFTFHKRHLWGTDLSESAQGAGGVGGLLMSETIAENGVETEPQFFHYDGNGNVTALTDDRGNQTATYRYDAFGNSLVTQGEKAVENEYRFSTKPLDEVSGLYYYGYRYYDPVTGRWPSRDPIEERGGVNLYASVNNDGLNQWDYLGLSRAGEEFANGSVTCTCDLIYECVPIDEDDSDCCGDVLEGSGNATERYVKSIGREEKKNRAEAEKAATIAAAKKAEEDAGNCPEKCVKWNIGGKCSCV